MKKQARLFSVTVALALMTQLQVLGQTENKVNFHGYNLVQYKQPVLRYGDKYEAYFDNLGEKREQGRIIIDEKAKTFTVKFLNGDEWICKYTKSETKNEKDDWFGEVTRKTFSGKWTDTGFDAELVITYTTSSGCITKVKSRKVVDAEYGIDTWKKIFTFATSGECIY